MKCKDVCPCSFLEMRRLCQACQIQLCTRRQTGWGKQMKCSFVREYELDKSEWQEKKSDP